MDFDRIIEVVKVVNWDWAAFTISTIALFYAVKTFKSLKQTQINTAPVVNREVQKYLLEKINLAIFDAYIKLFVIKDMLDRNNFDYRPRQWTLLGMRLPLENVHVDLFYDDRKAFSLFDSLVMRIKDYNLKLEIVNSQFMSEQVHPKELEHGILSILQSNSLIEISCRIITNKVYGISNYEETLVGIRQELCFIYKSYGLEIKETAKDYFCNEDEYSNSFSKKEDRDAFRSFMNSLADTYRNDLENDHINGMVKCK